MEENIIDKLEDKDSPFHSKLLTTSLALLKISKQFMGSYYPSWDVSDNNFRLKRSTDEADVAAARRKEPMKSTLPMAYPQIMTFVAFGMLLFNQRDTFFEIQGTGSEDEGTPEKDAEKILDRDMRKNKGNALCYQLLLNLGKFGVAIAKPSWDEKTVTITKQERTDPGETIAGQAVGGGTAEVKTRKTIYLGNRLESVSPYHFYPDTRLAVTRFQEGEFCAMEIEFSLERLRTMEADGIVTGLDEVKDLNAIKTEADIFYTNCRFGSVSPDMMANISSVKGSQGMVIVTEMQRWITPNKFKVGESAGETDGGDVLGDGTEDDDRPQLFLIWIANWNRVIRFEKLEYLHGEFTYCVGQFNHDQHKVVNEGLAEILEPIETTASWMLNSRIASVRKNVDARMFVDPQSVEWSDVVNRLPVIRMKPTARGTVDQWFKQIQVTDVTANHMQDIQTLWQLSQTASGISENMLGQYSAGRRDATQSKAVASGASGRMKTVLTVLWDVMFAPMGEQMLCNLQDGLTLEEFQKIIGATADQARFDAFNKRSEGVIGAYDFKIFDGTLPSEKGYTAQSMQELFLGMISNPQSMMMLQQEPFRSIFVEIAQLRGVVNPERFLPPAPNPSNVTTLPQPGVQTNPGAGPAQLTGAPVGVSSQPVVQPLPGSAQG